MVWSDVAEAEELLKPEFTHHTDIVGLHHTFKFMIRNVINKTCGCFSGESSNSYFLVMDFGCHVVYVAFYVVHVVL